jgi:hypothetical protein
MLGKFVKRKFLTSITDLTYNNVLFAQGHKQRKRERERESKSIYN